MKLFIIACFLALLVGACTVSMIKVRESNDIQIGLKETRTDSTNLNLLGGEEVRVGSDNKKSKNKDTIK